MQLKIDINVTLASGSKVELTKEQKDTVSSLVEKLLLGNKYSPKKNKRPLGSRPWSPEEEELAKARLDEIPIKDVKAIQNATLDIARCLGRTPTAITARFTGHLKQKRDSLKT